MRHEQPRPAPRHGRARRTVLEAMMPARNVEYDGYMLVATVNGDVELKCVYCPNWVQRYEPTPTNLESVVATVRNHNPICPGRVSQCRCGEDTHICAPWAYMGPWHDERCHLFGPTPPAEVLLAGERYDEPTTGEAHK